MTIPRNLSKLAEGANTSGVLQTTNGGTNLTSFTSNGVMYASSTSALTTGSSLTFDGNDLGVGTTPSNPWSTTTDRTIAITSPNGTSIGYVDQYDDGSSGGLYLESRRSGTANSYLDLAAAGAVLGTRTANDVTLYTNNIARFIIDSGGKVGIDVYPSADTQFIVGGTLPSSANISKGIVTACIIPSTTTTQASSFISYPNTQAASFTLNSVNHFYAFQGIIGAGSAVNNQLGFLAESNLTGATNNYGFYSNIAAGTGRYNFYAAGSADNYFAGRVGIGATGSPYKLQVNPSAVSGGSFFIDSYDSGSGGANVNTFFATTNYNNDGYGDFSNCIYARGTSTTPLAVHTYDSAGAIAFGYYDGSNYQYGTQIVSVVDGAVTTGSVPQALMFLTGANGYGTERMRIDSSGRVGIGGTPSAGYNFVLAKNITGATGSFGAFLTSTIQSDVTTIAYGWSTTLGTQAAAFTLGNSRHFQAAQGTIGSGSAITNQVGFYVDSSVSGATNNYGFYSNIASGTGRYNFYAGGSAANYFAGDMQFANTVTAAGTTGAQTINKTAGAVNFAAAATSLVVTNSLVTANSIIVCTVGTNDSTMKSVSAVAGSGSFTLYANSAATAETRVNFIVIN